MSRPVSEELIAVARKHENVYIDTSASTAGALIATSSGGAVRANAARHRKLRDARQSRRRGCRQRSAAASHGVVARAGSAKANGLTRGPTDRAPQSSIPSRTRVCLNSRRAMISPTRSAIGSPARDPPLCDVLSASRLRRTPRFQPGRAPAPRASRRQDKIPGRIGFAFRAAWRGLHAKHLKCSIGRPG